MRVVMGFPLALAHGPRFYCGGVWSTAPGLVFGTNGPVHPRMLEFRLKAVAKDLWVLKSPAPRLGSTSTLQLFEGHGYPA